MSVLRIQPSRPSTMDGRPLSVPQFGVTSWELAALKAAAKGGQEATGTLTHHKIAKSLTKIFDSGPLGRLFSNDLRMRGLSMEDVAARSLTLFGLYIPQGFLSIKDQRHPYETNGRNALMWTLSVFLTQFLKNKGFGVNSLFLNPLMIEKSQLTTFDRQADIPKDAGFFIRTIHRTMKPPINWVQRQLNRAFGMDGDYLAVLKDAGIDVNKKDIPNAMMGITAPWADLDNNKIDLINHRYSELKKLVQKDGLEALSKLESPLPEAVYRAYPKVLKRLNIFPVISTSIIAAVTIYVIGGLAMIPVYKFIAPLDKDFDAEAYRRSREKKKNGSKAKNPPSSPINPTSPLSQATPVRSAPLSNTSAATYTPNNLTIQPNAFRGFMNSSYATSKASTPSPFQNQAQNPSGGPR